MIPPPAEGLHVVDSSGWIEYFTDSPNADAFAPLVEHPELLIVPSLSLVEVFRWILRQSGQDDAIRMTAVMYQGNVVDLDAALALRAAKVGHEHRLPLADSVIYATAQSHGATLWTQDGDFDGLAGVEYIARRSAEP